MGAPIDTAHGVDPVQPATILDLPGAEVINASIDLWRIHKKHSTIALVFDKSGSMNDEGKIGAAKSGAIELINQLGAEDHLLFLPFSNEVLRIDLGLMGAGRQKAIDSVNRVVADGGTSLFEAIMVAREALAKAGDAGRINAIVVLTDGENNGRKVSLDGIAPKGYNEYGFLMPDKQMSVYSKKLYPTRESNPNDTTVYAAPYSGGSASNARTAAWLYAA